MASLEGRVALVTGAGSGVGRATALALAEAGAGVILCGRNERTLRETAEFAMQAGAAEERLLVTPCDVAVAEQVTRMFDEARSRFDRLDILVNNAGYNVPRRALSELSLDDWHGIIATNLDGAFLCVHAALPLMRAQRDGTMVHIGSLSVRRPSPLAGAAYTASKAGLGSLSATINAEERRNGIRSTVIILGDTNTPLLDKRPTPPGAETRAASIQPQDVAACILSIVTLPARATVEELTLVATELN